MCCSSLCLCVQPRIMESGGKVRQQLTAELLCRVRSKGIWQVLLYLTMIFKMFTFFQNEDINIFKCSVLPSFEVKLSSLTPFFYVDSPELTINIKATYLFNEEVDGTAYVVFGVMQGDQKKSFPSSLQRVLVSICACSHSFYAYT